jgi:hypothetical protein
MAWLLFLSNRSKKVGGNYFCFSKNDEKGGKGSDQLLALTSRTEARPQRPNPMAPRGVEGSGGLLMQVLEGGGAEDDQHAHPQ